ncbi:hypothetical protein DdX_18903 [Ditylenchus destructor]|uniref:Uncharacterized protein n=1 Tax=Ditylenchus destructor TaxID=166010 RepID=A0AAD4QXQ4_9BILA|nr:hypothetical protein DdX_18903 [Ditylenchus destructor]
MTSYFVPTCELEMCPAGTMCMRPLLYTEPTVCVHKSFKLHEDLLKPPSPWLVIAELTLMCACLLLLVVLIVMEIVKCCRRQVKKSSRNIEMSHLGNLGDSY